MTERKIGISCVEYQLCLSVVGVGKESFIISFHLCTAATCATISFKKVKPAIPDVMGLLT